MSKAKFNRDHQELILLRHEKLCYRLEEKKNRDPTYLKAKLSELINHNVELNFHKKQDIIRVGRETITKTFSNEELLNALFCLYDATLLIPEYDFKVINPYVKPIIDTFYEVDIEFVLEKFALKVSSLELCRLERGNITYCKSEEDLLHEYFVSSLFTNKLRTMIPNFHAVYAGFKLNSSKEIDCTISQDCDNFEKEKCLGMCPSNTEQSIDYLIYERLDGITLTEMLKICNLKDYLSWMIQILLALEMGVLHFGFTHNNLHSDNIYIVRPNEQSDWIWLDPRNSKEKVNLSKEDMEQIKASRERTHYIKYFRNNELYYVKCKSLAVMIDYEMAHVKKLIYTHENGELVEKFEDFGPIGFEDKGIYEKKTRIMYDLYKLIMWTLRILNRFNKTTFDDVKGVVKCFGFVYERDLLKALDFGEEDGYDLPYYLEENKITIGDMIQAMQDEFPKLRDIFIPAREFSVVPKVITPINFDIVKEDSSKNKISLDFFPNLELIMTRYYGLTGHEKEGFEALIKTNKEYLLLRELKSREKLINEINILIDLFNEKANSLSQTNKAQKFKLLRERKIIEAKIEILTENFLWLDRFKNEFQLPEIDYIEPKLENIKSS